MLLVFKQVIVDSFESTCFEMMELPCQAPEGWIIFEELCELFMVLERLHFLLSVHHHAKNCPNMSSHITQIII